jgi:hypothetical protein
MRLVTKQGRLLPAESQHVGGKHLAGPVGPDVSGLSDHPQGAEILERTPTAKSSGGTDSQLPQTTT